MSCISNDTNCALPSGSCIRAFGIDSVRTDTAGVYGLAIRNDGPLAWLRFGDPVGSSTAADSSGRGLSGVVNGAGIAFTAPGGLNSEPSSTAAQFPGLSGWVDLGNPSALQVGTGSLEAWVKTTNTDGNYHAIAMKWFAYGLFLKNGRLITYDWGAGADRDSGTGIADGNWHHVVLTFQSGVTNGSMLYVDGIARSTTTITVANQTHNAIISNGTTDSPQQFFPGTIDEVAYYGSILPGARVKVHYDAARYGGLIAASLPRAWIRLEEPTGSSTVADSALNGCCTGSIVHGAVTFNQSGALTHETAMKAAFFNGSSGWIDLGNSSSLQFFNGSLEAWVKTTNTDGNYHAIAMKWFAYGLFLKNGRLITFDWGAFADRDSGTGIADGNWHHVVLTFQSGVANGSILYVDGIARSTTTITVANQTHNAMISNGATDSPQQFFPGTIDEIAYYDKVLSPAQIQTHKVAASH